MITHYFIYVDFICKHTYSCIHLTFMADAHEAAKQANLMADVYEAAKEAHFEKPITDTIKAMALNENDLLHLTREDINSEFSHLKWFERRTLWTFFDGLKDNIMKKSRADAGSIMKQHGNVNIVA